jgi:ABC-2 type transport system ATP-binding protein
VWLERLGIGDRAGAKLEELSHGNQQRAQLAAALLHEPDLLVLDEPFAGLDPVAVQTLAEVLRGEAERGTAVLFSSHQLELVEDICEEVAIVDHGRVVATGDVDGLRRCSRQRRITLRLDGAPAEWLRKRDPGRVPAADDRRREEADRPRASGGRSTRLSRAAPTTPGPSSAFAWIEPNARPEQVERGTRGPASAVGSRGCERRRCELEERGRCPRRC